MTPRDDDPVFTHPEEYGIQNPGAPGEPDRSQQPPSTPVPGTGREAEVEHRRAHDAAGTHLSDNDQSTRRRAEGREAVDAGRADADDAGV